MGTAIVFPPEVRRRKALFRPDRLRRSFVLSGRVSLGFVVGRRASAARSSWRSGPPRRTLRRERREEAARRASGPSVRGRPPVIMIASMTTAISAPTGSLTMTSHQAASPTSATRPLDHVGMHTWRSACGRTQSLNGARSLRRLHQGASSPRAGRPHRVGDVQGRATGPRAPRWPVRRLPCAACVGLEDLPRSL